MKTTVWTPTKIRRLRKAAGLTQAGLADWLAVTRGHLSHLEMGLMPCGSQTVRLLDILAERVKAGGSKAVAIRAQAGSPGRKAKAPKEEAGIDWRKQLNDENDPDPDDELLPETPPEVIAAIGFDPLTVEDTDGAAEPKRGETKKRRKTK
jgi:transcriptional regulator with XRE-family HTH domain